MDLRVVAAPVVALCTLMAVTACTSAPTAGPVATAPKTDSGMDALLEGTLRLDEGCIVIDAPEIGVVVPVFPQGDAS